MTSFELMEAMGNVRDQYVLEAHSGQAETRKRRPSRRILLIAAIISLMLLLLGCAAVLLGLGELKLDREPVGPHGEFSSDVISLQGYAGTPNYQAAKEWEDFLRSYDQDGKLLAEAVQGSCSFDPAGISMEYAAYTCYTEEMMTKIDEICEKYGLEILGPTYFAEDALLGFRKTLHELGIDSLFWDGAEAELASDNLYYYREGSFQLEGEIRLTASGNPWPYATAFQYRSIMKTTFDSVVLTVGDIEDYTQWNYTLQDGTEVLLAQSHDKCLIIADRDTHFVTVNIPMFLIGKTDHVTMGRKALEAIADVFTFDYTPRRPDPDTLVLSDRYLPATEDLPEPVPRPQMEESQKQAFTAILEGSGTFFQSQGENPEEMTLARYCETFTEDLPAVIMEAALVDFEQDGIPEAVLRIALGENTDVGILVLDWEDGAVWGHTFFYREMQDIKLDGTFFWSASASNFGTARISFSKGEYTLQMCLRAEEVDGTVNYFSEGKAILFGDFESLIGCATMKEDPRWVSYPVGEYAELWKGFEERFGG